jgi:hypothetical protein
MRRVRRTRQEVEVKPTLEFEAHSIRFTGTVLRRGFWLYVVDIHAPSGRHLYVGRTGDSSSPHAGSPFSRIGQHLDLRLRAKGNALIRNLRKRDIDPLTCTMEMIAVGPLFPEEPRFDSHKRVRDEVAALECGLAAALSSAGYSVLGTHSANQEPEPSVLGDLIHLIETRLEGKKPPNSPLQPPAGGGCEVIPSEHAPAAAERDR